MQPFKVEALLESSRSLVNYTSLIREADTTPRMRKALAQKFLAVCNLSSELKTPVTSKLIERAVEYIVNESGSIEPGLIQRMAQQVCSTVETELSLRLFFAIKPENPDLMTSAVGFGEVVQRQFPSA